MRRSTVRRVTSGAAEVVGGVALATGAVAGLDTVAPIAGLGVVYLLAVLVLAIRRGGVAALATAVLSVLTLNYFFIAPIHRLTISDSENVVALAVFLIVAVVVARLATAARMRAAEAEDRARLAAARESEAEMLAGVASLLLRGGPLETQLPAIGDLVGRALAGAPARLELAAAPAPQPGERALRIPLSVRSGWLYLHDEPTAGAPAASRVVEALGGIMEVALERERIAARAAEADATRRADVAKTAVLHAISHDLRSPLTAITTAASALQDETLTAHDRRELIDVVSDESARLARLVDDLLDLSRVQAGAVNPQLDWCDLADVTGRAVAQLRGANGDEPIVSIELPADLPLVRADASQLERVFSNLLDNAVRHSPPGRPVRITGGTGGGLVTVRVIDEGPGIPPGKRAQIFEPFVRADGRPGGAGLGLAICRGFVEANGGRILLQSAGAHDTAFAVSLPLISQPEARV